MKQSTILEARRAPPQHPPQRNGGCRDLVLLHGWGMNAGHMHELGAAFGAGWRIRCLNLPGHGADAVRSLKVDEDVLGMLANAAPGPAVWVGWSLGGAVALRVAERFPQQVERLVLLASTPRFTASADWPDAMPRAIFETFAASVEQDPRAALRRFLALQYVGVARAREAILAAQAQLDAQPPSRAGLQLGLRWLRDWDLRATLVRLDKPALVILGQLDRLVPPSVAGALAALNPALTVAVLDDAGHAPVLTHPAQAARLILDFVDA
ncbi:MAG: alpha/beta fold hydrolase [Thiotrichales bacterium]